MKKNLSFVALILVLLSFGTTIFHSCKKDVSVSTNAPGSSQQHVSLYLTDSPSDYFAKVFIEIDSVSVLVDTCARDSSGSRSGDYDRDHHNNWGVRYTGDTCDIWETLAFQPGVYNLLALRNGLDTILAQSNINAGVIKYIKLSLGDSNYVVLRDSTIKPLQFRGWFDSTIYIPVGYGFMDHYVSGRSRCWLDFDISRSIIPFGRGFWLHPYFRCFIQAYTGGIQGFVLPTDAQATITATSSTDTATAVPSGNGEFMIRGLQAGNYSLNISSSNGYADSTINNVNVVAGKTVNIGVIKLHK
jgi:hypothetical protein